MKTIILKTANVLYIFYPKFFPFIVLMLKYALKKKDTVTFTKNYVIITTSTS
jgi:hypothetical protein